MVPEDITRRVMRALRRRKAPWRFLSSFCRAVARAGGKAYLVGGIVRDLVEGVPAKDFDLLVTGVEFDGLGRILRSLPAKTLGIRRIFPVGRTFPVYKVRTVWAEDDIDVATARSRRSAGPGARKSGSRATGYDEAREDVSRRDFTINGLLLAFREEGGRLRGSVVDFFGGLRDLERRRIRGIGRPEDRFAEDPLRMLRAIRLRRERPGYVIEKDTWSAISRTAPSSLRNVPGERVVGELIRSLSADPAGTVEDLSRSGILSILFPEAFAWKKGAIARMKRRYALMEKSIGRPLPETLLLANLLVDAAEAEYEALCRTGGGETRLHLSEVGGIARRLQFPHLRRIVRMVQDLTRLEHIAGWPQPHARIEAIANGWKTPGHLLAFYDAAQTAAHRRKKDLRSLLRIAARRPPLLSGKDLLDMGIPEGAGMEVLLEALREATLTGRIRKRKEAKGLALSLHHADRIPPARFPRHPPRKRIR